MVDKERLKKVEEQMINSCRVMVQREIIRMDPELPAEVIADRRDFICNMMAPLSLILEIENKTGLIDKLYKMLPWLPPDDPRYTGGEG